MNTSLSLTVFYHTSLGFSRRFAAVWLMLPLWGVLASSWEVKAQEKLYAKYSELPISEKYQLESMAPRMVGDKFEEMSEKEKKDVIGRNRSKRSAIADDKRRVETLLESGGNLNDPVVTSFFQDYVFAEMTQLGDETCDKLSNLGNLRTEFLKSYLSPKVTGPARQRFIDSICVPQLRVIYSDSKLHPAARLSAVYLLGMLDVVPSVRSPATAPTPSPQARDQLLVILQDQKTEAFLKVGAWAGLQRHVEIDAAAGNQIAEPQKSQIKQAAIQFIDGKFAGQDNWEADLSYWMKRRSTQMLGFLKDQALLPKILEVLNNSEYSIWLRLDALEAIEKLGLATVDQQVVESIGKFLAEALAAESKWISNERDNLIFDNLLYEDVDLEVTGTNWKDDPNIVAPTGGGDRRGGAGGGRFGVGAKGGMGAGMGAGLGETGGSGGAGGQETGGRGGGFGGGRGGQTPGLEESDQKQVELPNYMLNVSRRRIKSIAFIGKRVLMPAMDQGLHKAADATNKSKIEAMVKPLEKLLKDSDVGLVNLAAKKPRASDLEVPLKDEAPKKSITEQLMDACTVAADSLKAIVQPEEKKDENPLGS